MPAIRPARPDDAPALLEMIHALAAHHQDRPACTLQSLERDAFVPHPLVQILVAEHGTGLSGDPNGGLSGYTALTRLSQLQWGVHGLDMHHLFVRKEVRGHGVGIALVEATLNAARAQGCAFVSVSTHPDNTQAQGFYRRRGFAPRDASGTRFSIRLTQ